MILDQIKIKVRKVILVQFKITYKNVIWDQRSDQIIYVVNFKATQDDETAIFQNFL